MAEVNMPGPQKYNEVSKKEKIVKGDVSTRKRPLNKKLADIFFVEDVETVKQYVIFDVIIPGIKRLAIDALSMMLLGSVRSSSSSGGKYHDYSNYSRNNSKNNRTDIDNNNRDKRDYRDVVLASRMDAEEVLKELREDINEHDKTSVGYFYQLVGMSSDWNDNDRGWYDLSGAQVRPCRDGYYIDLPRAVVIK